MTHSFDIDHAKNYGLPEAIILHNVLFWLAHNKAFGRNIRDGKPWTFNSVSAYSSLFPYWTQDKIRRYFESLERQGVLVVGNFNQKRYDKTKWHTVADQGLIPVYGDPLANSPKAKMPNGYGENAKPIPDINTDKKQDSGGGKILILPNPKPVKSGSTKAKPKTIDFTSIEQVLEVLRIRDKHPEKSISLNTRRSIENAISEYGEQFICDAVRGRIEQAAKQSKPLYLNTFFDPDHAEWRAECAKVGEALRERAQAPLVASGGTSPGLTEDDYANIYKLMGQAQ